MALKRQRPKSPARSPQSRHEASGPTVWGIIGGLAALALLILAIWTLTWFYWTDRLWWEGGY